MGQHGGLGRAHPDRMPTNPRWQTARTRAIVRWTTGKQDVDNAREWALRRSSDASAVVGSLSPVHTRLHLSGLTTHSCRCTTASHSDLRVPTLPASHLPPVNRPLVPLQLRLTNTGIGVSLSTIALLALIIWDIKSTGADTMNGCPARHQNLPLESFQVLDGPPGSGQAQAPEGCRWVISPVPHSRWKPFYLACKYHGVADLVAVELRPTTRLCEIKRAPNVHCR
jgi:hypothetical protein